MLHPPAWFARAIATELEHGHVEVAGCPIHYLAWGHAGAEGLVFVHGGGAHAHWWTHVAATFAPDHRVVALDLSGHGDSGHRDTYSLELWADEVMATAAHAGITSPPVIIGHSMGGFVTIGTAARYSDSLAGVIVCDSPVTEPDPEVEAYNLRKAFGTPRVYPTEEEATARFRTVPTQANYLDYVMDHVARQSLKAVPGGVQWKFDAGVFAQFGGGLRGAALPYLGEVTCRLALLRSEHGLVTADIGASMYERLGRVTPVIELPEAGHHAMLDQPLILLTAIRTLLADWEHSEPKRRPPSPSPGEDSSVELPSQGEGSVELADPTFFDTYAQHHPHLSSQLSPAISDSVFAPLGAGTGFTFARKSITQTIIEAGPSALPALSRQWTSELPPGVTVPVEPPQVVDTRPPIRGIQALHTNVALGHGSERPFLSGRALAKRLGYPDGLVKMVPEATVERFVGLSNPFVLGLPKPGQRLIDVGCGVGFDLAIGASLVGATGSAVGVDLTLEMVRHANRHVVAASDAPVLLTQASATSLPLADHSVDWLSCNGLLCMVPDIAATLAEFRRVLRRNGELRIADVFAEQDASYEELSTWERLNCHSVQRWPRADWEPLIADAGFGNIRWSAPHNPFVDGFDHAFVVSFTAAATAG